MRQSPRRRLSKLGKELYVMRCTGFVTKRYPHFLQVILHTMGVGTCFIYVTTVSCMGCVIGPRWLLLTILRFSSFPSSANTPPKLSFTRQATAATFPITRHKYFQAAFPVCVPLAPVTYFTSNSYIGTHRYRRLDCPNPPRHFRRALSRHQYPIIFISS